MHSQTRFQAPSLTELARPFQIRDAETAAGRCFSRSLDIALEARQVMGIDVGLVRWRVVDDVHYIDHWAIELDAARVLDPTRVQVDRRRDLTYRVDDYPPNFVERCVYPASLLLAGHESKGLFKGARVADSFVLACAMRTFGFDVREAWRARAPAQALRAARRVAEFLCCFAVRGFTRCLEERAQRLVARLRSEADVSTRSSASLSLSTARDGIGSQDAIVQLHGALWLSRAMEPAANCLMVLMLMHA